MSKRPVMNPKKLGKLDNHKQEPWKAPLPEFIKHLYEKTVRETEFKVKPAHADFLSGAFFLKGFSPIAPPASEAPLLPEAYFFQPVSITRNRSYSPAGAALYRQTPSFARTFWLPKEPLGLDNSNP